MKTLSELKPHETGIIESINTPEVYETVITHGFNIGSTVKVLSKLPFKGAITCEINNTKVAMRATDAASIVILD